MTTSDFESCNPTSHTCSQAYKQPEKVIILGGQAHF